MLSFLSASKRGHLWHHLSFPELLKPLSMRSTAPVHMYSVSSRGAGSIGLASAGEAGLFSGNWVESRTAVSRVQIDLCRLRKTV